MIKSILKIPIFKRLIPSLGIRILKLFNKNRGYYNINNIFFYLDFLDPVDRQIILNKEYEQDAVNFLEDEMRKNSFSNFLDIGANSGYYSFYFTDKFKDLKIRAFEPNIDALNKFKKTLSKNSFKNVEVFNFGLSDSERKVGIRSMIKNGFVQSNSAVLDNSHKFNQEDFEIKDAILKVGDKIFNFKNEKLCVKIDVEGHEIYTLKGFINTLDQNKCLLLIEISDSNFENVNKFLSSLGYQNIFKSKYRSDYIYTNIQFYKI